MTVVAKSTAAEAADVGTASKPDTGK